MEFKVGDRITWGVHDVSGIVESIDGEFVTFVENTACHYPTGKPYVHYPSLLSEEIVFMKNILVIEKNKPKSPIQEEVVKKRKLVPGEYENLSIYESQGDLRIEFNKSKHTAEELEEASHILAQLAEFLKQENN